MSLSKVLFPGKKSWIFFLIMLFFSFSLDAFGKTSSLINSIYYPSLGTSSSTKQVMQKFIFSVEICMFFNSNVNITFTRNINQFVHLSNFYFLFPLTFLLINSILLSFESYLFNSDNISLSIISPNFLVWKFCGNTQFLYSSEWFAIYPNRCKNCAFPEPFQKLG